MNELERLEAMLRARPASLSNEQRRAAYEALGDLFPLAADVRVAQVRAHGVPAEWTSTPVASPSEVILYLPDGGYASSHPTRYSGLSPLAHAGELKR